MPNPPAVQSEIRKIEQVNESDVEAVLRGDVGALMSQWTEDFVVLPPTGAIIRGRRANVEQVQSRLDQIAAFEILEFSTHFEEIKVAGDYAFEWGTFSGKSRSRNGGAAFAYSGKVMRILQRQADGSWKMHRTMTINDPHSTDS